MLAGLSTPLHLAASLLALFAATGLALVVLTRPGLDRTGDTRWHWTARHLVALGALGIAVGHGLDGALMAGLGDTPAWLRALGLALVALGLSPRLLAELAGGHLEHEQPAAVRDPPRAAAILVLSAPVSAAVVAAAAGALAGLRAIFGGKRAWPAAAGLLAWGLAAAVAQVSPTGAAIATLGGSAALGLWLWLATARRLLARFVTAFVVSLLAVVVLTAAVLSGLGATQLVDEELGRLGDFSGRLADEIGHSWPTQATLAAQPYRAAGTILTGIDPGDDAQLAFIYELAFSQQDFFVVLTPDGTVRSLHAPADDILTGSFVLQLVGTDAVGRLVAGAEVESGIMTSGGMPVSFGGVRLDDRQGGPEDPPLGFLLTGRRADALWAAQAAAALPEGVEVMLEVGGRPTVTSPALEDTAAVVSATLEPGSTRRALTVNGRTLYASGSSIRETATHVPVGRVVVVSTADVIAQLERDQARQLFLLALVGALFAGVVAAVLSGRLVAPIRRLTVAAAAVREGDLSASAPVATPDEVGELSRTFNEMTSSLATQATQLREAASEQARLRARLEALTSSMSDALIATGPDGHVTMFNPAAERLVGLEAEQALGQLLDKVVKGHGPGDTTAAEALGAAASEQTAAVQILLASAAGPLVPTAATAAPVRDAGGQVLGRVCVLRDVSREAEVERMKTEFLSNVSHELRTPLTPIKGYAEVLARRDVGPDATREFANQILDASARLERIVRLIVEFAALDSGKLQPKREAVPVGDLVGGSLAEWRERHPHREFRRRVARELPPILVDEAMARRCLDEVIDNAVKFSPRGEPVTVSAALDPAVDEEGRRRVRITVRDHGVGMEPDAAARVFADFFQVDASETRHFGGLGLGLALVRRLVERLGGEAAVEAEPGEGAAVHLLLPAADDPGMVNGARRRSRKETARGARRRTAVS